MKTTCEGKCVKTGKQLTSKYTSCFYLSHKIEIGLYIMKCVTKSYLHVLGVNSYPYETKFVCVAHSLQKSDVEIL
jgi:hypothetical protein